MAARVWITEKICCWLRQRDCTVWAARAKLKELVEQGVPYDSDEMKLAYQNFKELEQQWKALERQHLELRDEIVKDGQD